MVDNTGLFGTLSGLTNDFISGLTGSTPSPDVTGSSAAAQADTSSVDQSVLDPAGLAQTAITGGDGGQSAQTGQQGQNQQQNQQQSPQSSAFDLLKKALTAAQQNKPKPQQGNPYQIGGPSAGPAPLANLAQRAGGPAPTPAQPNLPSPDASAMAMQTAGGGDFAIPGYTYEGASNQPEYGPGLRPGGPSYNYEGTSNQPEYGPGLRPGGPDYDSEGASNQPEYGPGQPPPPEVQGPNVPYPEGESNQPEYGPGRPTAPTVPPQTRGPGPTSQPGAAPFGGPSLGGLIRSLFPGMSWPLAGALGGVGMVPFTATPAETGEWHGGSGPGRKPSGPQTQWPDSTDYPQAQPGNPKAPNAIAPKTGKPVKVTNPKTGKKVDPQTGDPPTKKSPEGGEYQPKTGEARNKEWRGSLNAMQAEGAAPTPSGYGPIMQDAHGVNLGLPRGLGHLAQAALPLMALGLMAGLGGKRNRGHYIPGGRGFGGFGHPGGRGPWPYHHPTYGWQAHNYHPGGDWRPGNPRAFAYPNFNYNVNPFAAYALGMASNPQQNQQQQQGQPGAGQGPYGPGNHFGGGESGNQIGGGQGNPWQTGGDTASQGVWSANPFTSSVVGSESGGRNVSVMDTDGQMARGIYQFHDATWREYAQKVPGASQYATADQAPLEVQQAVAMVTPFNQWGDRTRAAAHRKFGNFNENMTIGQLAEQFGGIGKTQTGGTTGPNPQGNVAMQ